MSASDEPTEVQRDEAAHWLARRDNSPVPGDDAAFSVWLNADPRHRRAYAEAEAMWRQLELPARRLARRHAMRSVATSARGAHVSERRRRAPRAALCALVAGALIAMWLFKPTLLEDLGADVVIPRGETRTITLPDGSTAELGADTALALDFADGRRNVRLLRGEAYLDVRGGLDAPFRIEAGDAHVRVVGTRFNIDRVGSEAEVTVAHGIVEVSGRTTTPVRVRAGQRSLVADGRPGSAEAADLEDALAWRSGRLAFQRVPLARVVAALQRQKPGRILVIGDRLRGLRVSGTFPSDDVDGALSTIAATLGVDILRITPWITLIR